MFKIKKKYLFLFVVLTLLLISFAFYHLNGDKSSYYISDSKKIEVSRDDLVGIKRNLRDQYGGSKRMYSLVNSLSAPLPKEWIYSTPAKILDTSLKKSYDNIVSLLESSGNVFYLHYDIYKSSKAPETGYIVVDYDKTEKFE